MELVKLGGKGQLTIPRSVLREAGWSGADALAIQAQSDGVITLRPVGIYPIEMYSDARVAALEANNAVPDDVDAAVRTLLASKGGNVSKVSRGASSSARGRKAA